MNLLDVITPDWEAPSRVRACVTTRMGGVSRAEWQGLNLGTHVGDDPLAVKRNRRMLVDELSLPSSPVWLEQVHGKVVIDASTATGMPLADASYTDTTGVVCSVMTADCLPVLFTNEKGSCVAAAHSGWRGLHQGILEATVEAMPEKPKNILAWMGPAIGAEVFEVGTEVRDVFVVKLGNAALSAFHPSKNRQGESRFLADIYALARLTLKRVGVNKVFGGGFCTFTDDQRFYSYRREAVTGRMASLIWMT